jgi:hypothetical protein
MKVHSTYYDSDPDVPDDITTSVWDLADRHIIYRLFLGFGNGVFGDMRVIGDSDEALQLFRGIMRSGGYQAGHISEPQRHRLYQAGDECYGGFVCVDPTPHPEAFEQT